MKNLLLEYSKIEKGDGYKFEEFVSKLLSAYYTADIENIGGAGDGGVDLIMNGESAIQVKYYSNTLDNTSIQEVFTGAAFHNLTGKSYVVTNSTFTIKATEYAKSIDVELITGSDILYMIDQLMKGKSYYGNIGDLPKDMQAKLDIERESQDLYKGEHSKRYDMSIMYCFEVTGQELEYIKTGNKKSLGWMSRSDIDIAISKIERYITKEKNHYKIQKELDKLSRNSKRNNKKSNIQIVTIEGDLYAIKKLFRIKELAELNDIRYYRNLVMEQRGEIIEELENQIEAEVKDNLLLMSKINFIRFGKNINDFKTAVKKSFSTIVLYNEINNLSSEFKLMSLHFEDKYKYKTIDSKDLDIRRLNKYIKSYNRELSKYCKKNNWDFKVEVITIQEVKEYFLMEEV